MSYTKGELIDQLYIKVTGGQLSPDVNVKRVDIAAYMAQAINNVIVSYIRATKREDEDNSSGIDVEFYKTYFPTLLYDNRMDLYYLVLPSRLQQLPSGQGIASVAPTHSRVPFTRVRTMYQPVGFSHVLGTYYWYEKIAGDTDEERLYFENLGSPIPDILLRMIPSFEGMNDNEIVSVPAGLEINILDLANKWFSEQRRMPADMLANNNDEKQ
jgi:hypothetical protein